MPLIRARSVGNTRLILSAALFLTLFFNLSFFRHALQVYPPVAGNLAFLASLFVLLTVCQILLLALVSWRHVTKPLLIAIFLVSSVAAYFMDTYSVILDDGMIRNIFQTNTDESYHLFSFRLVAYFVLLGVLPSVLLYRTTIVTGSIKAELLSKLRIVALSLVVIVATVLAFGKFYGSFFREHKTVRFYANPSYYIYSAVEYLSDMFDRKGGVVAALGTDAHIPPTDKDRELIIVVVGEAARADRFSLNGYTRETNPLLKQEGVISFTNVRSCGTSTAVSVPCMFSVFGHGRFTSDNAISSENLLDVLTHAGVHVLWRDNNSDSKGVAVRVPYQRFKQDNTNTICDVECRDEGMLVGLQDYVDQTAGGDVVIVLHQMGNHGPAYYKRYPRTFEKFTPVCASVQLEQCSMEEIGNAYDNAILYTDYFLFRVIAFLKHNDDHFETAMVYVSDHGESLGENGLYLHGLPYALAPDAQTHVPAILFVGRNYHVDRDELRRHVSHPYTHDNIFHTVLGLMEIQTLFYRQDLDLVHHKD